MGDKVVSNRLHRSGAIDFNVTYATRQANIYQKSTHSSTKRMYAKAAIEDELSVREAEPLYTPKRQKRGNFAADVLRQPVATMSSLNGLAIDNMHNIATDSNKTPIDKHEEMRELFFKEHRYMGLAVSPWAFDRAGKQQEQFVATSGGGNTLYCDVECQAGDTIVVDMPLPSDEDLRCVVGRYDPENGNAGDRDVSGFVRCTEKRGIPKGKQTLVVRPMPPLLRSNETTDQPIKTMRASFLKRGQILGTCIKGGKRGEHIDVILASNAIVGCINSADVYLD